MTLAWILTASAVSGLVALGLAFALLRGKLWSHDRSHLFLSFAAGTLLAVAFLDLLPEAFEAYGGNGHGVEEASLMVLVGFLIFFSIEKLILWYHCHEEHCDVHSSVSMILIGDTLHNMLDGVAIAVAFMVSVPVGIATTIAVLIHEVPQEVADFSILLGSGMKPRTAVLFNVLSALASLFGAAAAYFAATLIAGATPYLLAITAGGFIYISAADLIPEIHKEMDRRKMAVQFLLFLIGAGAVYAITRVFAH